MFKLSIFYIVLFDVLCVQSIGRKSGIIFNDNQKTALLFSLALNLVALIFSNCIKSIKEFHYSLQFLSELSYLKLSYESIFLMIYGSDRCS
jgi:hypothetical protein